MSQNYNYPSSSTVTLTGTPNGAAIPTTSILIAGENPAGLQEPLQTTTTGILLVSPDPASTGNVNLTQVGGAAITLGIKTAAASIPVTLPSDGTLPLPTGASTSALQTSGNASLSSIDTKTPPLGQALAAASVPVVLTAAQISTLTPLTTVTVTQATGTNLHTVVDSSALPSGAATSANQTNGTQLSGLVAGTAIVGKFGIDQTTPGTTNGVQVNAALPAGTNNIGKVTSLAGTPAALTITQAAITVGTSAVRLTVSGSAPAATRVVLVATPDAASTAKFYIGSATVTSTSTTRGIQIAAGQSFIANNDAGDYYIVSDTASQTVEVMEQA